MCKNVKGNSIYDRWESDIQSYKNGAQILVSAPQCDTCTNNIKGNALHCSYYDRERKPKYVLFHKKECPVYENISPIDLTIQNERENKIYGGLFGFCVGDVLGVPVEFSTREERKEDPINEMRAYGTYHQPFGTWSDDTSLTICLIDAINRGYSIKKVAKNFVDFYEKGLFTPFGEVFDIGNSTRNSIIKICNGINAVDCGGKTESDNGNGSLMRILPITFYGEKLVGQDLMKLIEEVSSLTHGHNRSKLACIIYVVFAIQIFEGYEKEEALNRTIVFVNSNCVDSYSDEFRYFERILRKKIINASENEIESTGYVIDTLEAALWAFFTADGYRNTILKAINLGGDTDTIAAIAGGLAGIYYGLNEIPQEWIQSMVKKDKLYQMFKQFCIVTDFLHYTGNFKRYFSVYSNRCTQTKVSNKVLRLCWKPIQYRHFR